MTNHHCSRPREQLFAVVGTKRIRPPAHVRRLDASRVRTSKPSAVAAGCLALSPVPSRTRKLSSSAPMVLHARVRGRAGRRPIKSRKAPAERLRLFCCSMFFFGFECTVPGSTPRHPGFGLPRREQVGGSLVRPWSPLWSPLLVSLVSSGLCARGPFVLTYERTSYAR